MNVTFEKQPKCLAEATATFSAEEVASEKVSIVNSYASQASLPGFRAGKAPKKVVEKRFAKEIEGELESQFLSKLYKHALDEEKLDFITVSDQSLTHEENGDLVAKLEFILSPEFELGEYKNLPVTVPKLEVTDEILEEEILKVRTQQAQFPTKEEGPVEKDDIAVITYSSNYEGEESIAPYDGLQDYWIKAGDDNFLPGFSGELIGMVTGSEKVISHTFADDFQVESLQGQKLDYTVTLKEIKTEELASEEDLVKQMFGEDGTVEELHERVREFVSGQQQKSLQEIKVNSILEQIGGELEFDLPERYVEAETQNQVNTMMRQSMQYGMDQEALKGMQGEILENARESAQKALKNNFILQKIADLEEIEVSDQECFQSVAMQAYQSGQDPKKVVKDLQKSGNDGQVRQSILIDKVIAFLVDSAEVTEEEQTEEK